MTLFWIWLSRCLLLMFHFRCCKYAGKELWKVKQQEKECVRTYFFTFCFFKHNSVSTQMDKICVWDDSQSPPQPTMLPCLHNTFCSVSFHIVVLSELFCLLCEAQSSSTVSVQSKCIHPSHQKRPAPEKLTTSAFIGENSLMSSVLDSDLYGTFIDDVTASGRILIAGINQVTKWLVVEKKFSNRQWAENNISLTDWTSSSAGQHVDDLAAPQNNIIWLKVFSLTLISNINCECDKKQILFVRETS